MEFWRNTKYMNAIADKVGLTDLLENKFRYTIESYPQRWPVSNTIHFGYRKVGAEDIKLPYKAILFNIEIPDGSQESIEAFIIGTKREMEKSGLNSNVSGEVLIARAFFLAYKKITEKLNQLWNLRSTSGWTPDYTEKIKDVAAVYLDSGTHQFKIIIDFIK